MLGQRNAFILLYVVLFEQKLVAIQNHVLPLPTVTAAKPPKAVVNVAWMAENLSLDGNGLPWLRRSGDSSVWSSRVLLSLIRRGRRYPVTV
jgi:hypothetical protein